MESRRPSSSWASSSSAASRVGASSLYIGESRRDRMQVKLKEVKKELRKRMHQPIPEQGRWLAQVVRGYFAYHAVPTNRAKYQCFPPLRGTASGNRTLRRRAERLFPRGNGCRAPGRRLAPSASSTFIPGHMCDLPSNTRGKNRMPYMPLRAGTGRATVCLIGRSYGNELARRSRGEKSPSRPRSWACCRT